MAPNNLPRDFGNVDDEKEVSGFCREVNPGKEKPPDPDADLSDEEKAEIVSQSVSMRNQDNILMIYKGSQAGKKARLGFDTMGK